jgi:signal transduction histidine kinase
MILSKLILTNYIFYILLFLLVGVYFFLKKIVFKYHHELKELRKSKDNFVSLISHELRTPLTSIKGFSEMLISEEAGKINDMQRDFLLTILTSAKKLEARIDNIIELSSFKKSIAILNKEEVNWSGLIKNIYDSFKRSCEYQKLDCKFNVDKNIGVVKIDKIKIEKALSNLLLNAIKFTGPGDKIEINSLKMGNIIETSVIDTGVGVSEKMRERVFDKFVQIQDSLTRDIDGLGLGLTLTKNIIESHGGKIIIDAAPERGTKVTFTLPIQ